MAFTYTTLKQAIQDWTENNETTFVNEIDTFILAAEERILKEIDLDVFRRNAAGDINQDNKYLSVPDDYLASYSLHYTNSDEKTVFLQQKDVNFLQEAYPDNSARAEPLYYALFDINNFLLAPIPDLSYDCELHYYYRPQSITASSDGTSWIGTNAPNTLLYGCLIEAYTFMKGEPDIIQMYKERYAESVTRLKVYGEGRENTDAYREGLPRVPVT